MGIFAVAGTQVFIGPAMVDSDVDYAAADFSALAFVEIKNTVSLSAFGDTAAAITADEIGRPRTRKVKGTRNAGTFTVTCNANPTDPGQIAAAAAQLAAGNFAVKVQFPDKPVTGSNPVGSIRYFAAKVAGTPETLAGANSFAQAAITFEIDSNIVRVAPTAGP